MALQGYNEAKEKLSVRQLRVLQLRVHGLNAEAIGSKLKISPSTVESHLTKAYSKTRCRRLSEVKQWLEDNKHLLSLEDTIQLIKSERKVKEPTNRELKEAEKLQDERDRRLARQFLNISKEFNDGW